MVATNYQGTEQGTFWENSKKDGDGGEGAVREKGGETWSRRGNGMWEG